MKKSCLIMAQESFADMKPKWCYLRKTLPVITWHSWHEFRKQKQKKLNDDQVVLCEIKEKQYK